MMARSLSQPPNFEARMKQILESELLRACRTGDKDAIAQLVDDKNVALDCVDSSNGLQPLIIASKYGHFEIVKYLLWHNTDILDNIDGAGWSALHWSILNGYYLITKELIEFGADLDLKSKYDNIYPLHLSIFYNQPNITKLLLDNDCNLDIYYNDKSILDLLDYLQFRHSPSSSSTEVNFTTNDIDKFRNIIYNSSQYKSLLTKMKKYHSYSSTPKMILPDDHQHENNKTNDNDNKQYNQDIDDQDNDDDDDDETPIWKKYLSKSVSVDDDDPITEEDQNEIDIEQNKKDADDILRKYLLTDNDDTDTTPVTTPEPTPEILVKDDDDQELIKRKYFHDDSDENDTTDEEDAIGDIMNFLQKDDLDIVDPDLIIPEEDGDGDAFSDDDAMGPDYKLSIEPINSMDLININKEENHDENEHENENENEEEIMIKSEIDHDIKEAEIKDDNEEEDVNENVNGNDNDKEDEVEDDNLNMNMDTNKDINISTENKQSNDDCSIISSSNNDHNNQIHKHRQENVNNSNFERDNNNIISIDLDRLSESILHRLETSLTSKFVSLSQFNAFKKEQLSINDILKEEQSKSLKEIIEVNQEMNEMQNMYQQLYGELNALRTEIDDKINENRQKQEDKYNTFLKENDNKLSDKIRNETHSILDSELTKYEKWIRAMLNHVEDNTESHNQQIQSLINAQSEVTKKQRELSLRFKMISMRVHEQKQPSIETLKVGKIIEMELINQSNNGYNNAKSTPSPPSNSSNYSFQLSHRRNIKNGKKRPKMMSPVSSLIQSHTDFNGNSFGVDAAASNSDSDDDTEMNNGYNNGNMKNGIYNNRGNKDKHGRSQSVRIPRGKVLSLNSTSREKSSSSGPRKGRKKLKLKRQQNSAPPTPQIVSIPSNHNLEYVDNGNESEDGDDKIVCKVEREGSGPIVVDDHNKTKNMKPRKMRRKRSNSWALDSGHNSPKKGLGKGQTEDLNIVDYNPHNQYWE